MLKRIDTGEKVMRGFAFVIGVLGTCMVVTQVVMAYSN